MNIEINEWEVFQNIKYVQNNIEMVIINQYLINKAFQQIYPSKIKIK